VWASNCDLARLGAAGRNCHTASSPVSLPLPAVRCPIAEGQLPALLPLRRLRRHVSCVDCSAACQQAARFGIALVALTPFTSSAAHTGHKLCVLSCVLFGLMAKDIVRTHCVCHSRHDGPITLRGVGCCRQQSLQPSLAAAMLPPCCCSMLGASSAHHVCTRTSNLLPGRWSGPGKVALGAAKHPERDPKKPLSRCTLYQLNVV
jgi:hypothetical protein